MLMAMTLPPLSIRKLLGIVFVPKIFQLLRFGSSAYCILNCLLFAYLANFSSGSAIQGNAFRVAYDMAKGAIIALTMDMAVQLAQHGIRTNAIAPGQSGSQVGGMIKMEDRHPANLVGRAALPEEQAATALFLASDDAAHIFGQTINVDGGSSLM